MGKWSPYVSGYESVTAEKGKTAGQVAFLMFLWQA